MLGAHNTYRVPSFSALLIHHHQFEVVVTAWQIKDSAGTGVSVAKSTWDSSAQALCYPTQPARSPGQEEVALPTDALSAMTADQRGERRQSHTAQRFWFTKPRAGQVCLQSAAPMLSAYTTSWCLL